MSDMKWTPTKEKLPEKAGFYLVTKKQKTGALQVAIGNYSPDYGWSGSGNFNNVLAWFPIPEAYAEEPT